MNVNLTANHNRNTRSGLSYVYASYVLNNYAGYVAVIDPNTDEIIKRISTGQNPTAMCLTPSGDKLYVADETGNVVFVYSTDNFRLLGGIAVGSKPAAIFIESSGNKGYIASYEASSVIIFDAHTYSIITTKNIKNYGMPFAIASNEKSPYVYIACKRDPALGDSVLAFDINDTGANVISIGPDLKRVYDSTRNPLIVHPNGHTLIELADVGVLNYADFTGNFTSNTTSFLDNTVSGVYLDNGWLFCTMREERDFLKVFENLDIDVYGNITSEYSKEIPSYKSQDKIRTSLNQKYVGVTLQPTYNPAGKLQIIDVDSFNSRFFEFDLVGDLAFYSDSKAYVGEVSRVRPVNLATGTTIPIIDVAGNYMVRNIISGYSNQSS
ncbi:YncE family protein [Paenibacillus sp. FSL M7-0420]|uniref:YncE family protein n=1 Tax=Paenibacillus sp. FSL M7-0420 TaxID=2921609 RepID=UPI0030F57DD6